ncbi:hypothetical protein K7432_015872 [Basidiobolus ranarum]|uniref:Uncharacterized protein n=1 Tax=Basidiobolus ranarum TaxID=34480 RepID=A0ABR2WFJ6_9FUNG
MKRTFQETKFVSEIDSPPWDSQKFPPVTIPSTPPTPRSDLESHNIVSPSTSLSGSFQGFGLSEDGDPSFVESSEKIKWEVRKRRHTISGSSPLFSYSPSLLKTYSPSKRLLPINLARIFQSNCPEDRTLPPLSGYLNPPPLEDSTSRWLPVSL